MLVAAIPSVSPVLLPQYVAGTNIMVMLVNVMQAFVHRSFRPLCTVHSQLATTNAVNMALGTVD
jgi:hypothetical protein